MTGKELSPFGGIRDYVYALAYSPDGHTLAAGTGNHDGTVWLLDAATGKLARRLVIPRGYVTSLAFSADGQTLASKHQNETRIWDVPTGKLRRTVAGVAMEIAPAALSPDGRAIAGGDAHAGNLRTWDTATGMELRAFAGHRRGVYGVAYSPDGMSLASAGADNTVRLWEAATGKQLWQAEHEGWVQFAAFSPDGRTVASGGSDGRVYLWEVITGKERRRFDGHRRPVHCGVFSRDGMQLATGSDDTTALIWDLTGRFPPRRLSIWELDECWSNLAGEDAAKAYRSVQALAAAADQSVAYLKERIRPIQVADPKRVAELLASLDRNDFAAREQAERELEKLGLGAETALRQALADKPSLEVRRRVERLLQEPAGPATIQAVRAIEALERISTPAARHVLAALAQGAPKVRPTQEAQAALERLEKSSAP